MLAFASNFKRSCLEMKTLEESMLEHIDYCKGYMAGVLAVRAGYPIEIDSPFKEGEKCTLETEIRTIKFRGEDFTIPVNYYKDKELGYKFTDAKLDDDMMWTLFRAWCEKHSKEIETFSDVEKLMKI